MNRLAFTTLLVCAALAWAFSTAGVRRHAAGAASLSAPAANPAPPATLPAEPQFTQIIGHEGFWRIARTRDGVWWFLSPENKTEFLNGITTVQPALPSRDPHDPGFISRDWDQRLGEQALSHWSDATLRRVQEIGFKSLGAWCNPALHQYDMPMTRDLNVSDWAPFSGRLFSPQWEARADAAIAAQTLPLRNNRNLIGYYIDNELNWSDDAVGPREFFDQLPAADPDRREVLSVIRDVWPNVSGFNREWNTNLRGWSDLEKSIALPAGHEPGYQHLRGPWLRHVAEAYFRITTALIRRHDPNHLILGCRFRGWVPPEVPRGARGYTDAQSLNYYAGDALLDAQTFRTINEESGQPLVISEYSFHALDGRSGDRNLINFPALVGDQQARAEGYRTMTARLARVPYVIGADWFQWMDEPHGGRVIDGEDANFGIVDVNDRPYQQLADAVHQTTPLLDHLHAGSASGSNQTVWRQAPDSHTHDAFAGAGVLGNK